MLSILVNNGADINTTNDRGEYVLRSLETDSAMTEAFRTPLHIAVKHGRDNTCARYLLELGANPSQPDAEGRTALHMFYNPVTAWMFQYHSNDIDTWAQDTTGRTVLHYLAWSSQSTRQELMRCLQPADKLQLSIKDSQGRSILHYAAQRGNIDLIKFLLGRPEAASLCMPDSLGRTLLHHATESGRVSTIDLFLAHHLDRDAVDNRGHTILHHACQWGNLRAVKHLLDLGFEYQLDTVDNEKLTPLQLARQYRSESVVQYLQEFRSEQEASSKESDNDAFTSGPTALAKLQSRLTSTKARLLVLLMLLFLYQIWR
jgi:ankyrin repeat protein